MNVARYMSAARIVSNTRKFDLGLTYFRRSQLYWLDVVDRVWFSLRPGVQMSAQDHRWLQNTCRLTAKPSPAFLVVATCDSYRYSLDRPIVKASPFCSSNNDPFGLYRLISCMVCLNHCKNMYVCHVILVIYLISNYLLQRL